MHIALDPFGLLLPEADLTPACATAPIAYCIQQAVTQQVFVNLCVCESVTTARLNEQNEDVISDLQMCLL